MLLLLFSGGSGHLVTSTRKLQLPINCILADQQYYKSRIDVHDIGPANVKQKPMASGSATRQLSKDAPTFTTKTGNKGYD